MLGLIKKDLLLIKGNLKTIGLIFCLYVLLAFQGSMELSAISSFLTVVISLSIFSYEANNKWDAYALTLPKGRKYSVLSKYLVTIFIILFLSIITFALTILVNLVNHNPLNIKENLAILYFTQCMIIIIESLMYPLVYKFGIEKSRIVIFFNSFSLSLLIYFCCSTNQ